jgi:hypothetical protein
MIQHPFYLSNLKNGQKVRIGKDEMGSGLEVEVTYDESSGYPSIWIQESDRVGRRTLSVEGSFNIRLN